MFSGSGPSVVKDRNTRCSGHFESFFVSMLSCVANLRNIIALIYLFAAYSNLRITYSISPSIDSAEDALQLRKQYFIYAILRGDEYTATIDELDSEDAIDRKLFDYALREVDANKIELLVGARASQAASEITICFKSQINVVSTCTIEVTFLALLPTCARSFKPVSTK